MRDTPLSTSPLPPSAVANTASLQHTGAIETLHAIAYCSEISLAAALHRETFRHIEQKSSYNNQRTGTTGFLCFKQGQFFQYIEGETLTILNLLNVIKQDPRHHSVKIILEEDITERRFSSWAMHCFNLSEPPPEPPISHYLLAFAPKTWDEATTKAVINSVQRRYNNAPITPPITSVPNNSYVGQVLRAKSPPAMRLTAIAIVLILLCALLWLGFFYP